MVEMTLAINVLQAADNNVETANLRIQRLSKFNRDICRPSKIEVVNIIKTIQKMNSTNIFEFLLIKLPTS